MARKLYDSEVGTDELLKKYAEISGIKIGKLINQSIYNTFLPVYAPTLIMESEHILKEHVAERLNQKTIKQALSRGVIWLREHPINDSGILNKILIHYNTNPYDEPQKDERNDYIKQLFDDAQNKIKNVDESYVNYHSSIASIADAILSHWDRLWDDKIMYEVIAYIVADCEIKIPYDWYGCISYIKDIETAAMMQYNLKDIQQ